MAGSRTVREITRSKKLSRTENPPARKDDSGDDDKEAKDMGDVNGEPSSLSSSTASLSESEAAEEASDPSAAEQREEDSDDEEIRLLFEQKVGKKAKKNGGKNERTESSGRTSGVKKTSRGEKLKKKVVEEEEDDDEKESERGEGSSACKFPMNRIHRIMKDQGSTAKIAQEAIFLTNKASEKFLELYCKEAYACAFLDHKSQVAYDHLASVVSKRKRFDFLTDIVPERVKAEDALAELLVADK